MFIGAAEYLNPRLQQVINALQPSEKVTSVMQDFCWNQDLPESLSKPPSTSSGKTTELLLGMFCWSLVFASSQKQTAAKLADYRLRANNVDNVFPKVVTPPPTSQQAKLQRRPKKNVLESDSEETESEQHVEVAPPPAAPEKIGIGYGKKGRKRKTATVPEPHDGASTSQPPAKRATPSKPKVSKTAAGESVELIKVAETLWLLSYLSENNIPRSSYGYAYKHIRDGWSQVKLPHVSDLKKFLFNSTQPRSTTRDKNSIGLVNTTHEK